jgi:nitrous oxidase accessory protein NosD
MAAALALVAGAAHAATIQVRPGASIQAALNAAHPGDTIRLAPGRYLEDLKTVRDGTPAQPIRIEGPADAVISGAGTSTRVFQVSHDHIHLQGFTLDGKFAPDERKESYRDILLYVVGTEPGNGVTGLRVLNMRFRNAGGECLRLRYQAQKNEVAHSSFERCGVYAFHFKGGGKNGEAIYIGTRAPQLGKYGAPDGAVDRSDGNWVHHNTFNTHGNECVDIKDGSSGNIVEHNTCTGQRDPESGAFNVLGNRNVFRYNTITGSRGSGIRLGGFSDADGIGNEVYGNTIRDNAGAAVNAQRGPQGRICENTVAENARGLAQGVYKGGDPSVSCNSPEATATVRVKAASKKEASSDGKSRNSAPPMVCGGSGQCVVARIEGDERSRIKILEASDPALRGKHLVLREAAGGGDLKALAGKTVRVEFTGLAKKVLQNARVVGVMN